jgi:diguanylate cyclase (GGDEF)-like protein
MNNVKILIVDDDPAVLELLAKYISRFQLDYSTAGNGEDAIRKLKEDSFTIVLTDIMMPKMNGMELLEHVKHNYPDINVIIVTGYSKDFTFTDVIKAGASDFIAKPFNADELEAKLKRVIREQELIHQLEYLSKRDGLTNLYNRRYFDIKLTEETKRGWRQGYEVFLLFIDINKFKGYNDKYGHLEGDKVLIKVGKILRDCIRKNVDWAFRYGGDEFAVILEDVDHEQSRTTAGRIHNQYHSCSFDDTDLSIGIARFFHKKENSWQADITNLINRADRMLYQAKESTAHIQLDPDSEVEER